MHDWFIFPCMHDCFISQYMHDCFIFPYLHDCLISQNMHDCFIFPYMNDCCTSQYMHDCFTAIPNKAHRASDPVDHASMLPAPTQSDTLPGWHCRACIGRRIRPFVLCTRLRVLCVVGGNNLLRNGSSILDTVMFASGLARMLVRCCYCHIQHQ
jgi:hypothetical protein